MWTTGRVVGLTVGSAVLAAIVSGVSSYSFARKRMESEYQDRLAQEIETTKNFYIRLYKRDGFETPEEAAKTLGVDVEETEETAAVVVAAAAMRSYQGIEPTDTAAKVMNIFRRTEEPDDSDEDEEVVAEQDVPHVISQKTFLENDVEYTQHTLTYFALDKTLVDEREDRIEDVDDLVGVNNLDRFGHKSKDPNVVYVRNDSKKMDFEILLSQGKYAKEVLGLD